MERGHAVSSLMKQDYKVQDSSGTFPQIFSHAFLKFTDQFKESLFMFVKKTPVVRQ